MVTLILLNFLKSLYKLRLLLDNINIYNYFKTERYCHETAAARRETAQKFAQREYRAYQRLFSVSQGAYPHAHDGAAVHGVLRGVRDRPAAHSA